MARIRIMPEILSNKIAAGEVVDRPASVVKELVENALDAGSRKIQVDIEQGGRRLIRVADDGMGMAHDDALLSLERYATSKIFSDQDLFAINTLGFRGEALPSIAAVSHLHLVTRPADADAGVDIRVAGGKLIDVCQAGAAPGTVITVSSLFYNVPARRKFLKTVPTEMGHIGDCLASIAMGRPQVQWRLTHNGKIVRQWARSADAAGRVVDVLGRDVGAALIDLDGQAQDVAVRGWVAAPHVTRATSRGIFVYVNGRFVRDRAVQHALFQAFGTRLMKGRFPVAVLFIELPFDQVDINVHPTKHEVRFVNRHGLHQAVLSLVSSALAEHARPQWQPPPKSDCASADSPAGVASPQAPFSAASRLQPSRGAIQNAHTAGGDGQSPDHAVATDSADGNDLPEPARNTAPAAPAVNKPAQSGHAVQGNFWQSGFFSQLRVIGQLRGLYIVCESPDGLVLIDQHAAHERVVYEALRAQSDPARPQAQRLMTPQTIELSHREADVLQSILPRLARTGFEIEPFGGTTFAIKSVPVLLGKTNVGPIITEVAEKMAQIGVTDNADSVLDDCLKLIACHRALRAGRSLEMRHIQHLLKQLEACRVPSHCPHGRPTWIVWSAKVLEKSFQRIVVRGP